MAKIFKFTGYFVDPAGDCSKRDVKTALEEVTSKALDTFSRHVEVKEAELGEWDDSHPEWDIVAGFVDKSIFGVPVDEIGKTVFLTREEVGKALEEMKDGNG